LTEIAQEVEAKAENQVSLNLVDDNLQSIRKGSDNYFVKDFGDQGLIMVGSQYDEDASTNSAERS